MKILHTADWHLGKWLLNYPRISEQKEVLAEIGEIADREQVDAVLIAGDLFDTFNPPAEAQELFYRTMKRLARGGTRPVIAIAGNHDSPDRIENPDPLARECGIILIGYPNTEVDLLKLDCGLEITRSAPGFLEVKIPGQDAPLRLITTAFANEYRLKKFLGTDNPEEELRNLLQACWAELADEYMDANGVNLLMAHLFVMKEGETPPAEPDEEKPILHVGGAQAIYTRNFPEQVQYVALGHLHGYREIGGGPCPVVYSSSPLTYSFSEAGQRKYVAIVEAEPGGKASIHKIELTRGRPLLRHTAQGVTEAVEWLTAHPEALVELTIETDNYLSGKDQKALHQAHDGIVTIIPAMKNRTGMDDNSTPKIELNKSMEELFTGYFQFKNQNKPDQAILDLFHEILSQDNEKE